MNTVKDLLSLYVVCVVYKSLSRIKTKNESFCFLKQSNDDLEIWFFKHAENSMQNEMMRLNVQTRDKHLNHRWKKNSNGENRLHVKQYKVLPSRYV